MSHDRDMLASGESIYERPQGPPKPSLLDRLRALFGLGGASIRDDIQDALEDTSTQADFSPQERTMLKNVLALHEVRVEDVMVPRADIVSVALENRLIDVLSVFREAGHSRLPVHGDTLDDPRGMIHIRDFVDYIAVVEAAPHAGGAAPVPGADDADLRPNRSDLSSPLAEAHLLRPVLFVPPSMPALDLLVKMQATRTHMALVIDEYGGTDGLVSIEDIVEVIVGDIEDEHDLDESPKIEQAADGTFIADARAVLEDVSEAIGTDLAAISDAEEIDTLGGLVTTLAGHVPVRGEIIVEGGLEFEVLDADPRRIKRLRIHMPAPPSTAGAASDATADKADADAASVGPPEADALRKGASA